MSKTIINVDAGTIEVVKKFLENDTTEGTLTLLLTKDSTIGKGERSLFLKVEYDGKKHHLYYEFRKLDSKNSKYPIVKSVEIMTYEQQLEKNIEDFSKTNISFENFSKDFFDKEINISVESPPPRFKIKHEINKNMNSSNPVLEEYVSVANNKVYCFDTDCKSSFTFTDFKGKRPDIP